jgi:hypothetical protein
MIDATSNDSRKLSVSGEQKISIDWKPETLRVKSYDGDIRKYLRVSGKRIGVVREEWADAVLSAQGYKLPDEYARSVYTPDKLFEAIKLYDGPGTWVMPDEDWKVFRRAISKVRSYFADLRNTVVPLTLDENVQQYIRPGTNSGLPGLMPKSEVFKV